MSAPAPGDRIQIIAGRTARRSIEVARWKAWTGTIVAVGEDDTCDIRIDTTGNVLRLYRDEFRVVPTGWRPDYN